MVPTGPHSPRHAGDIGAAYPALKAHTPPNDIIATMTASKFRTMPLVVPLTLLGGCGSASQPPHQACEAAQLARLSQGNPIDSNDENHYQRFFQLMRNYLP